MQSEKRKFLYKVVYDGLKKDILEGKYKSGDLLPSENQIADEYTVDRTTVRKALQLLVEEKLVEKRPGKGSVVTGQGYEMECKPSGKGMAIGFLLPRGNSITKAFYALLFYEAEKECQKHGCTLVYSTLDDEDNLDEIVSSHKLSGAIFVSNVAERHLDRAIQISLPSVLANGMNEKMPSIVSDNFNGAYQVTRYLLEMGHRRIAVITGITSYYANQERYRGFSYAMMEAGVPIREEYIISTPSWEMESGVEATRKLLESCSQRPTAIFGFNDRLAVGAVQAIQQEGMRVPDDISVVGYDNLDQAKYSVPRITTIESHVPLLAKAAVVSLFQQIEGGERLPVRIQTPVELVVCDSVKKLI